MGLHEDINAFLARLDAAIGQTMETSVADAARNYIADAVESEVYAVYTPVVYERRGKEHGGLADTSPDNMVATYNTVTRTLEIRDMSRDNISSRLVAPIVESGAGYTYDPGTGPRPFHRVAEQNFKASGEFEKTLTRGLKAKGF